MSIERTGPGSATDAARAREDASGPREAREPAPREQTDRFRDALEHARHRAGPAAQPGGDAGAAEGEAGDGATLREGARADAVHRARDGGGEGGGNSGQDAADAEARLLDPALAWQAQHALRGDAPLAAPAAVGASNAVADLIERHVRQLAVAGGTADARADGRVLLRLADATLPGTDLLLSREAGGWVLRADVRSRESFEAIRDAAPGLVKRFADRELGTLRVEPHLHA